MAKINSYNEGQSPAHQIKLVWLMTYYCLYVFLIYMSSIGKHRKMFFCFITFICGVLNSWMHRWTTRVSSECTCVSPGPSTSQLGSRVTRGTASWSPSSTITTNHRLMTPALILQLKWVTLCIVLCVCIMKQWLYIITEWSVTGRFHPF